MSRYAILHAIERLDPEKDHQRIIFLSTCYDFPFDTTRALEFALFRTFCVPSISTLLHRTGEFSRRSQKRYDDTDIIVSELLERGYDSERGKRALRRLNQLHGRFAIANDDFLYVLSTFVFEPIRWNEKFGWRLLCEQEQLGYFYFWREVGRRMNIRGIPAHYDVFERFNIDYEREHYRFTETNQRVGAATRELFRELVSIFFSAGGAVGDLCLAGGSSYRGFRFSAAFAADASAGAGRSTTPRRMHALAAAATQTATAHGNETSHVS
jgi:hypothetical protein